MNKNNKEIINYYEGLLDFKDNKEILRRKLNISKKKLANYKLLIPLFSFATSIIMLIVCIKFNVHKDSFISAIQASSSVDINIFSILLYLSSFLLFIITLISTFFYIKTRRK